MKSKEREDGWWVTELPYECSDCGPYPTKAEAEELRRSLQRSFDHLDDWKFWTSEPKPKKTK